MTPTDILNNFQNIYGQSLAVGSKVTISPDAEFASEWTDQYFVTAINWRHKYQELDITISDSLSATGTDGWSIDELIPVRDASDVAVQQDAQEPELETVTSLYTRSVTLFCPHCNTTQDGFIGNPSGTDFDCDNCGKTYHVHAEADIEHCP